MTDKMPSNCRQLKPCRCGCGGEAVIKCLPKDSKPYLIYCDKCFTASWCYPTESEAIEAWNLAMGERTAKVSKGAYDLMRCECGMPVSSNYDYCPKCRARLDWE